VIKIKAKVAKFARKDVKTTTINYNNKKLVHHGG